MITAKDLYKRYMADIEIPEAALDSWLRGVYYGDVHRTGKWRQSYAKCNLPFSSMESFADALHQRGFAADAGNVMTLAGEIPGIIIDIPPQGE